MIKKYRKTVKKLDFRNILEKFVVLNVLLYKKLIN